MNLKRLIVMVIMIACVVFLVRYFRFPVRYVFSGDFLASRFRLQSELAGDSYQSGIGKMIVLSGIISAIVVPVVMVVRWLTDMSKRYDKCAFIIFSSVVFIFPISCLIVALHMLYQYVWAMGITVMRWSGISFCVTAMIALCGLWLWMTVLTGKKQNQEFVAAPPDNPIE